MRTLQLKCSAFLGCMCFGAAIYDDFTFKYRFTDEQIAQLREAYKGKQDLGLKVIEDTMSELYSDILGTAESKATEREHRPISTTVKFQQSLFRNK